MRDYRNYNNPDEWRKRRQENFEGWQRHREKRRGVFGLIIVLVGIGMLAKEFGWHFLHFNIFYWPIIMIAVGLFIGIRHRFRSIASFVLIAIGTCYLLPQFTIWGVESTELAGPVILILGGLFLLMRPKKKSCIPSITNSTIVEDTLNIDVAFGGRKAIVTSKNFKGGYVSAAFGGAEINLMQADSIEPMYLDLKVSFGGVEIIVPSHWDVQVEVNPSFGSVEDHRVIRTASAGEDRRSLVLRGSCAFGSIEIKSY